MCYTVEQLNITNHTIAQVTNAAPMAEQQYQQNLAEASVVVLELCGRNRHKQNDSTKLYWPQLGWVKSGQTQKVKTISWLENKLASSGFSFNCTKTVQNC